VELEIAKEVLHQVEIARDHRSLALHEELWWAMKLKTLGLSSLQWVIARQESQILWLSEGDAPTKFFHVQANAHSRHKHICSLVHDGQVLVDEYCKAEAPYNFFNEILDAPTQCQHAIDLDALDLPQLNLAKLSERFTQAEILAVIKSLSSYKASGPYGFTTRFMQECWDIIRPYLMATVDAFWRMDTRNFHDINEALLTLLPKTPETLPWRTTGLSVDSSLEEAFLQSAHELPCVALGIPHPSGAEHVHQGKVYTR
jgi:hypothetical protein